jgi:hypothetical protein
MVRRLLKGFSNAYDSLRREVLYSILIYFVITMELLKLIKMCVEEHLSDSFHIQNILNLCFRICH